MKQIIRAKMKAINIVAIHRTVIYMIFLQIISISMRRFIREPFTPDILT